MAIARRQSRLRGRPLGKTESADFASKVRESSITQLGKIKQVGEQKVADQAKAAQTITGQGPVAAVAPPVLQPKPVETLVAPTPLSFADKQGMWKEYKEGLGKPTRPEVSAVSGESPDPHGVGDPYGSVAGVQAMGALSDAQAATMAGKGFQAIGQMAMGNVPGSIATVLGQKGTIDQAKAFVDTQLGQLGADPGLSGPPTGESVSFGFAGPAASPPGTTSFSGAGASATFGAPGPAAVSAAGGSDPWGGGVGPGAGGGGSK